MAIEENDFAKNEANKKKLIEFMKQNNIAYSEIECCVCDRFCINFGDEENACRKCCCNSGIVVQKSDKDICRIYPNDILYITIEDRKSVLYLTDGKIETNYRLDFWKDVLGLEAFAQPHHSFIVNLNYVDEVTKEWVRVRYGDQEYRVYTSMRKIASFKKALLAFNKK
ncbi:MAG: LytTR family transcriptional regulator DNA-binding domain-containing protein [Clostridia bacterium]|nr:LytTR family transcriptional regulator DNA-binding domain-containing protein [Clostridia bacterium]